MPDGAGWWPLGVALHKGLSVGMIDAASTAKCGETSFLWTVCGPSASSYFVWAARPRHNPRGQIGNPGGAVTVSAIPVAWNCSSIWSHSHPSKVTKRNSFLNSFPPFLPPTCFSNPTFPVLLQSGAQGCVHKEIGVLMELCHRGAVHCQPHSQPSACYLRMHHPWWDTTDIYLN